MANPRLFIVAALLGLSAAANAASLTRGPYLQSVDGSKATVAFRLDTSCAATVHFSEQGGAVRTASSSGSATFHGVALTGLTAGKRYTYSIEACGSRVGGEASFQTPQPAAARKVHFAVIGDSGTGGSQQKAVIAQIQKDLPEVMVTMGDNAYSNGTEAEYQSRFFSPMASVLPFVPLYPSLGNHEYGTSDASPYLDAFILPTNNARKSERFYSFDWSNVHFAVLDSNCATGYSSSCTLAEQSTWLAQDLAASKADWKIVILHHPPYSSGEHGSQLTLRRNWAPILEAQGVDLVLTGHDHNYERSKPMKQERVVAAAAGSPVYLVVGNSGATLRPFATALPSWAAYRNDTDYGYLDVQVTGGTLVAQMRNSSGAVKDSFTLTKTLSPIVSEPTPTPTPPTPVDPGEPSTTPPLPIVDAPDGSTGETGKHPDGLTETGADTDATLSGCGATPGQNTTRSMWVIALAGSLLWAWRRTLVPEKARPPSAKTGA